MKVSELINILASLDPSAEVILAKDGEGNGFSPLADLDDSRRYEADSTWSGELVENPESEYYEDDGTERWDEAEPCVVLWPVN